ncbi:MAG: ferredoxin-type protein NapG [Sulfuricurvum sp. PD_MW2]|jgi:ferredoxin-type protein NapG|uniref:ferredoxin-type protein NapG n=1 Tax=Sulfuricurvum sp. PD_MW2 TaxID=2027917 RepID=UPI000C06068A|nr:ferredoxin-type protein NapG [Sulfuricurvum sp. PD_MW2]PHM17482.1 MAG: ferredoxin-type protein NapG [Sulfuricurvum sp. PD_MW2]
MKNSPSNDRRRFLLSAARGIGLSAMGALVWSAYVGEVKAAPLILRPPGALREDEFIKNCIKCGLCVEACPYDTLKLAKPGDNLPIGTPYFTPRNVPCYMCDLVPCVPACPSGALSQSSLATYIENHAKLDIKKARMGLAVIDEESCIATWGIQCDACYRACPLMGEAITIEFSKNERTGKHAFLKPVVHADVCTGCGMCEHACVTKKAAIYVLPRALAMGEVGNHYIKGWEPKDEKRLDEPKPEVTHHELTKTKISEKSALDSLNDESGL